MILDSIAKLLRPSDSTVTGKQDVRNDALAAISSVWQNAWTGLGSSGTDRVTAHVPGHLSVLTPYELEVLYLGDGLPRRIVNKIVDDAFKNGITFAYAGDNNRSKEMVGAVKGVCEGLGLEAKARKAAELGRAYGMGGIFIGANGGQAVAEEELTHDTIQSLDYLLVLDRRDLTVESWRPPRDNSRFAEHEYYIPAVERQVYGLDLQRMHASHIVAFGGLDTAIRDRRRYWQGYDSPALQPVWDTVRRFNAAHQSIDAMIQDGSQGVMMVRDLWKGVTQPGGLDKLETRMQLSALYRATHKWLVLDAGGSDGAPPEDFKWVQRQFSGLSDLTQEKQALVAAAADMPITKIFGRSPAGENATGEHDALNWDASVVAWWRQSAMPQCTRVAQIAASVMGAEDPENFYVDIPPLAQMSALQRAEIEERIAKTDEIRIAQGYPETSILEHRYGGGEFRSDPPMLTAEDKAALEAGTAPVPKQAE